MSSRHGTKELKSRPRVSNQALSISTWAALGILEAVHPLGNDVPDSVRKQEYVLPVQPPTQWKWVRSEILTVENLGFTLNDLLLTWIAEFETSTGTASKFSKLEFCIATFEQAGNRNR
ncbi:hypothetical protein B0A49_13076 [Cryomyces minteri]|uniref:Uncharacterized protein n=1 Tax=Cryomyces minteri TaxID=331657 RepID=A0A4U0WDU9_9PEZI|nr:hypothetical protein B0A49_13076 [Cryomyces minteri]